jgi:hypothetical protein
MRPHVENMMPVLLAPHRLQHLGGAHREQSVLTHHLESAAGLACFHRLQPLVADALSAHLSIAGERGLDRAFSVRIELYLQRRHEAGGSQHAESVLTEPGTWLADGTQNAAFQIPRAVERVDQSVREHVVSDGIDREIAPRQITFDIADEEHGVGTAAVAVCPFAAQRRDFVLPVLHQHRHGAVRETGRNHPPK